MVYNNALNFRLLSQGAKRLQRQREDGLVLRSLSAGFESDKLSLPQFYTDVFVDAYGEEDERIGEWAVDLLSEKHPFVSDDDVWVVVDPNQNDRIVSAVLLIPQTWRYCNIEFGVGRIELVATHKDYRRRGLIRDLMTAAHERSAALGHEVQAIGGIPYFYRQFGYAMAVEMGIAGTVPFGAIVDLQDDEKPKFTLRAATSDDIPQLLRWSASQAQDRCLTVVHSAEWLEYDLTSRNPKIDMARQYHIIIDDKDTPVGMVRTDKVARFGAIRVFDLIVGENASYLSVIDDVLRSVKQYGMENYAKKEPYYIGFSAHLYYRLSDILGRKRTMKFQPAEYAWYLRVADLPAFINKIKPVLEQRLYGSIAHGYTGKLHIDFYGKTGLLMTFENGQLLDVTDEQPALNQDDAAFPFHYFLNVLFGHRSVRELEAVFPDVGVNAKGFALLNVLFPKQPSSLAPID